MANEWQSVALQEICELRAGSVFKPHLQGKTSGDIPFVKVSDMNLPENTVRIQEANNWISHKNLEEIRAKPFPAGTVVFAKIGEALRQNRLRQLVQDTIIDNNMMGAVPKADHVDPLFFYYALSQFDFANIAQGTALPYLTVSALYDLNLPLPPLVEQREIAYILGSLDNKIELNRQMSKTLETMASVLFKSWFINFDPVRSKVEGRDPGLPKEVADSFPDSFEESDIGEVPKGWRVCGLDEIATFLNGLALQKYPPTGDNFLPVIKIAQLRKGETSKHSDRASADLSPEYIVNDGDVIFSWSGTLECILWTGGKGALNQHLFKVTSKEFPKWFYYLWIHEHLTDFRGIAADKATTMGHIKRHHLSDAKVIVPDDEVLALASNILEPAIDQLIQQRIESRSLAALRSALTPKMLRGEIDIKPKK